MLDGCCFTEETHPPCPHHPYCHCTLDPIDYAFVLANATVQSDYSKFDPYLFNTTGTYPHGKEKLFNEWGYHVEDAPHLQAEMEGRHEKSTYPEIILWENWINAGSGSIFGSQFHEKISQTMYHLLPDG